MARAILYGVTDTILVTYHHYATSHKAPVRFSLSVSVGWSDRAESGRHNKAQVPTPAPCVYVSFHCLLFARAPCSVPATVPHVPVLPLLPVVVLIPEIRVAGITFCVCAPPSEPVLRTVICYKGNPLSSPHLRTYRHGNKITNTLAMFVSN
ncbi:hypothetical protein CBL_13924 [Carabus blaptoides fortunei]